ncbi:MAG: DUF2905 domain-containing protein [Gammaproteobacteria bacterium]
MSERAIALVLITVGVAVLCIGVLIWSGALSWFGRLPGDIKFERFPLTSLIVTSVAMTIIIQLIRRLIE